MNRKTCFGVGWIVLFVAFVLGGCTQFLPLDARIGIEGTSDGPIPLTVRFTSAASTGPIASRTWDFGDPASGVDNVSTLESPTHTYGAHDAYLVTLTIASTDGRSSFTTAVIRATNPPPVPRFDATPDHGPAPLSVAFDLSASVDPAGIVPTPAGTIASFSLDFGDGSAPATGTNLGIVIVHTYSLPGYRVATLTVVDNDGASASATHPVTVEGVVATLVAPGGDPVGLAYEGGSLWVADSATRRITRVRANDGQVQTSFDAPGASIVIQDVESKGIVPGPNPGGTPAGMAWGNGALWVACLSDGKIYQVNPYVPTTDSGHILAVLDNEAFTPFGLAFGGGALWTSDLRTGRILKIDPLTGAVLGSIPGPATAAQDIDALGIVPVAPAGLAWASGSLWASVGTTLYRLDPGTGAVLASTTAPGPSPAGLAFDGVYLWVADPNGASPGRLDRLVVP